MRAISVRARLYDISFTARIILVKLLIFDGACRHFVRAHSKGVTVFFVYTYTFARVCECKGAWAWPRARARVPLTDCERAGALAPGSVGFSDARMPTVQYEPALSHCSSPSG